MLASLMMYLRPETEAPTARYWALLRRAMAERGIAAPEALSNRAPAMEVWTDPALLFSQTCGLPFRRDLHPKVGLIGTPDFGLPDCPPGYYNSTIVVRRGEAGRGLVDFAGRKLALNEWASQSGYAAALSRAEQEGIAFGGFLETSAHINSARAVAEGRADIAFIDTITWQLLTRYESFTTQLDTIGVTDPMPGHAYITAQLGLVEDLQASVMQAIERLTPEDRAVMGLKGLVQVPVEDYLAVPNPPTQAQPVLPSAAM